VHCGPGRVKRERRCGATPPPPRHPSPDTLRPRGAMKCAPAHITGDLLRASSAARVLGLARACGVLPGRMDGHRPVTLVPYFASADSHEPEAGKARHSVRMKLSRWFGSGAFPVTDRAKLTAGFLDDGTGPGWERGWVKGYGLHFKVR